MKKIIIFTTPIILVVIATVVYLMIVNKETVSVQAPSATSQAMAMSPKMESKPSFNNKTIKLPAEIVADKQTDIYAKVLSYVKHLPVDIGSQVSKGDLLLELESPELTAHLASLTAKIVSLESQFKLHESNYTRILKASKAEGTVSEIALEEALTKMESSKGLLDATKADYLQVKSLTDYLEVRAPFSGIITQRNIDTGYLVGPSAQGQNKPLLVLQDNNNLRLRVSVAEKYTPYINLGDSLNFTINSLNGHQFSAPLIRRSGALNTKLRAEQVEADIKNSDNKLKPGMVADVTFTLKQSESVDKL